MKTLARSGTRILTTYRDAPLVLDVPQADIDTILRDDNGFFRYQADGETHTLKIQGVLEYGAPET